MNTEPTHASVAEAILAGDNRDAQMLVARGLFPLPPEELIELQLALTASDDSELAETATRSLAELEPKIVADVIDETSNLEILGFFAGRHDHPVVVEAILRSRRVSAEILGQVAARLEPELQEVLLLRQDLIVEHPVVLDRLEENPKLSNYSRRRIREYRQHLLAAEQAPADEQWESEGDEWQEPTSEDMEAAIAEALQAPAAGEVDEATGLTEAQIRTLPVPVRLKLARGAPRSLRALLIKDKNPMVAVSVVQGNVLTESEVELIVSNKSMAEEVLNLVAKDRQWSRKYNIVHALVRNPRTSVGLAVRLTSRLSTRDLRNLSRDRNVAEAVRSTAARLYRIKAV